MSVLEFFRAAGRRVGSAAPTGGRSRTIIEAMERRAYFSVSPFAQAPSGPIDLQPSIATNLPNAALGGSKATGVKVSLSIGNSSAAQVSGSATARLYLSTDPTFGAAADTLLSSTPFKFSIRASAHKSISLHFKSFPNVSGSYFLLAQITGDNVNTATVATSGAVQVSPAFVNLAANGLSAKSTFVKQGQKETLSLTVANNGNVAVTGKRVATALSLSPTPDGANPISEGTLLSTLSLKPGAAKVIRIAVTVPRGLPTGTYFPVIDLDPANTLVESTLLNNTIVCSNAVIVA